MSVATDMMELCHETYADLMQQFVFRTVTYRAIRNSVSQTQNIKVQLGQKQAVALNTLGMEQNDPALPHPKQVDRDYIVVVSDLEDAGIWEPRAGDFIDDTNDGAGASRWAVKGTPGEASWRYVKGSYVVLARIHTKWQQKLQTYWSDAMVGADGAALTAHSPEVGDGGYASGDGTLQILSDRLVAVTNPAYVYFDPDQLTTVTRADVSINTDAGLLDGKFAEFGVAVRCEPSGAGRRDGYYCTLKVGYTGGNQTTKQLRIVRRRSGVNTTLEVLDLASDINLASSYKLVVKNSERFVVFKLQDAYGKELSGTTIQYEATLLNSNKAQGLYFDHTLTDPTSPWIDNVSVEAS